MKTRLIAMVLAAMALCAPAAAQLVANTGEPIDITGDSLEVVDDTATWSGHVRAVQGDAILSADRLIATLDDEGGFKTIRAVGNVRYSNGKEAIAGELAVYDSAARSITISKNVVVTQGKTVMTGGDLVYWLDTGRLRFTAAEGARIRGIFHTDSAEQDL